MGDDIGAAEDIVVEPETEQNTRVPDPDRLPQAPAGPAPGSARP
jgi:hypothetical protein